MRASEQTERQQSGLCRMPMLLDCCFMRASQWILAELTTRTSSEHMFRHSRRWQLDASNAPFGSILPPAQDLSPANLLSAAGCIQPALCDCICSCTIMRKVFACPRHLSVAIIHQPTEMQGRVPCKHVMMATIDIIVLEGGHPSGCRTESLKMAV